MNNVARISNRVDGRKPQVLAASSSIWACMRGHPYQITMVAACRATRAVSTGQSYRLGDWANCPA